MMGEEKSETAHHQRRSIAPYDRQPDPERADVDPARPWQQAGRSWRAHADRLRAYYRHHGTWPQRMLGPRLTMPQDLTYAAARGRAAARVGRRLDRLAATGWVVWHDRRVAGTEMVLDHVLIGPDGITVLASVHRDAPPRTLPVPAVATHQRDQLATLTQDIIDRVSAALPDWQAMIWPIVAVDGPTAVVADQWPFILPVSHLLWTVESHPRHLAAVHVADLSVALEPVFPYTSIGS